MFLQLVWWNGIHVGLKIQWSKTLWVRVPPPAQSKYPLASLKTSCYPLALMKRKANIKNKQQSKHNYFLASAVVIIFTSVLIKLSFDFKLSILETSINSPLFKKISYLQQKSTPKPLFQIPKSYGRSVHVPILTYHYIGNNPSPQDKVRDNLSVPPNKFEEQMAFISQNGFSTISLDTMYMALKGNITLPPRSVILTFDDGYIDFYVNAFPILQRFNLNATVFIPTGLMDNGYYLHWDQIKEMDKTGLISFQSHSVNHAYLISLPLENIKYEMEESKKILEASLGKSVNFFAYPYGVSNAQVWDTVKQTGFLGAVGTWGGSDINEGTIYDCPRLKVGGSYTIEQFSSLLH